MPDNWGFVAAAYGLTAIVLGLYWRRLERQEKELATRKQPRSGSGPTVGERTMPQSGSTRSVADRTVLQSRSTPSVAERSREPSGTGHPRSDPDANPSLPK